MISTAAPRSLAIVCTTSAGGDRIAPTIPEIVVVRHLASRGHRVAVLVPDSGPLCDALRAAGAVVQVWPFVARQRTLWGRLRTSLAWPRLRQIAGVADLVFSLRLSSTLLALRLGRNLGVSVATYLHGIHADGSRYARYGAPRCDAVLAVSEAALTRYREASAAECSGEQTLAVVRNGIDAAAFAQRSRAFDARERMGIPRNVQLVGMAGAYAAKGPQTMVEAAARVRAPTDLHWALAGDFRDADFERELRRSIEALGLAPRFHLVGHQANIAPLMAACEVWVVPSEVEALPMVALEASSLGCPVIASRVGGLPEAVIDGVTGLLVQPGRPDELATAVQRLVASQALRAELGERARALVAERFDLAQQMACLEDLLADMSRSPSLP